MFSILSRILRIGRLSEPLPAPEASETEPTAIQRELYKVFGRALCIRHVDAGSCNDCELEIHALGNAYYNLEGAGIHFVASPRHADLLLVTGPVSVNMEEALKATYAAMPEPKWVLVVGDGGANGGIFGTSYASRGAVSNVIPVNAVIDGCPPSPLDILNGIVQFIRHLTP